MKLQTPALLVASLVLLLNTTLSAPAQGTFQNLGFESATLVPVPGQPPFYYFAQAFPGWIGYIGGVPFGLAVYNSLALDTASFGVIDPGFTNPFGWPGGVIQGNFTALLMGGLAGAGQPSDASLVQTGLVPVGTESLRFRAFLPLAGDSFSVSLGGVALSLVPLASTTNFTLYGADVHAWAGQTVELGFTSIAHDPHTRASYFYLDSIQFSNQPVPEPRVLSLVALGGLVSGWWRLRRRR